MADRSMQGRTALNIIEIASFRRSSRCATWRGDETNTSPLKFNLQFVNMRKHFNAFSSYISEETRHYLCTTVNKFYDLCISLFMDILRMIFTFITLIIMKSCADPVSHNVSKCRLGIFCSALRYVAVLQKTKKIEKEMMRRHALKIHRN